LRAKFFTAEIFIHSRKLDNIEHKLIKRSLISFLLIKNELEYCFTCAKQPK
jgi:hypothetical protein